MARPPPERHPCSEVDARLSEYLDDELGALDRVWISMHLATCGRCAGEARALAAVVQAVHRLGHVPGSMLN